MVSNFEYMNFVSQDVLSVDKLNRLADNVEYVFEMSPEAYLANTKTNRNIKFVAGVVSMSTTREYADALFSGAFSPGCKPIVVGVVATASGTRDYYVSVSGIDGSADATADGARFKVSKNSGKKKSTIKINYIAMGY